MRTKRASSVPPDWSKLLVDAVHTPGIVSSAYQRFWNYSIGNQLLALFECMLRGLTPGPIHTFRGWMEIGRHVKKGEKAITLCMPVTVKRKRREKLSSLAVVTGSARDGPTPDADSNKESTESITVFTYKPRWFVLSQTDGADYMPTELPAWSESQSLRALNIERVEFDYTNGNCQGFARLRQVAVSPIAVSPHETLFHELAHVVLGHTVEGMFEDHDQTPKNIREVEAECVALICCESLNLPGAAECRGYIQHWLQDQKIADRSAQKIFKAADTILKAGYPLLTALSEK